MSTASEEILARYKKVEREADVLGRVIGVKRLRPSQMAMIEGMTADMDGSSMVRNEAGDEIEVSKRTPFLIVASVCEIDDAPIPFPKNRAELNAIFDNLDAEGMSAAVAAFAKLFADATPVAEVVASAQKKQRTGR